jgi:hypothetical protein
MQRYVTGEVLVVLKDQPRELISGPNQTSKARLMSFNETQTRVINGLLTGHNTRRRYLHSMGLTNNRLLGRCGAQEERSAHILCECEVLVSLRHVYLGSFFLDPEDIKSFSPGAIWNFIKGTGLP